MRKIFLSSLLLLSATSFAQSVIKGHLKQMKPGTWIYSQWYDTEHMAFGPEGFDSVQSTKDGFTISLPLKEGGGNGRVIFIGRKSGPGKGMFVYADKGQITLTGNDSTFNGIEIGGSLFARELNEFHHLIKDQTPDSLKKALSLQWIDAHPNSPISVFIMYNIYEPLYGKLTIDEQETILNKLQPGALKNKIAEAMRFSIRTERLTGIGKTAPDFTQNDTLGKPVSLKDFRGKYVLVDFWASWCAPCRRENPNVVKAFNQYKDKGFTVLGVSLDQAGKKDAWLKAIHDDGLTWTHVSDLKYWNNAVAKLYDVKAVPVNFLVGPDGSILAKNLRGDALHKKLAELLQHQPFSLSGTVKGKDTGRMYLIATDMYEHKIVDSVPILNGKFEFKGTMPHPLMAFIAEGRSPASTEDPNSVSFFLDPGNTVATLQYGNFKNVTLTGATTQTELKELKQIDLAYVQAHPDSYAAIFLLRSKTADKEKLFQAFSPAVQQSGFGQSIKYAIDILKLGLPGSKATDFSAMDINGTPLKLADHKGKYVLLDFWASWCVPCRAGNPHLLSLYAQYKSKGLEIIGISDDDRNPDAWHKAVEKDGIGVWKHVLRGLDMKKVMAGDINLRNHKLEISNSKYGVTALPTKVLIDPSGNIIGRYGSDEAALDKKLAEVMP
ncbi:redoxin domain-containing protein [Chitinophaga sp. SYP-B3965]|uniref:redoxin domain-containing protein n=1 Tax=Chitinophaga sp. SYP-B3965 TaxID=2663120 RepID=UPI001299C7D3|nr:redoxin domain-containing protein [Chitinophaga sp. SYP-B3965]MRG45042.1 redoxin domain-containing protein [Chitinophaga sp. SYP-B3965]